MSFIYEVINDNTLEKEEILFLEKNIILISVKVYFVEKKIFLC